jgi:phospholipid/cholesterol/gamma-HCH transport system substrate-binding protein
MGSKISPTMIGAFVVGAIVLVVAGALLFGGGKFLQEKVLYFLFFDSSVEGLNVGAPVIFRGVQVGQVTEISAIADPQTYDVRIRVKIELVKGVLRVGAEGQLFKDPHETVERLIQKGVRASLRMQSFVTGLLFVALDFHPDTPIKLMGLDPAYPEVPTIPSDMDQLKSSIQQAMAELKKLPLDAVLAEVLTVLKRAGTLLETPELKQALVALYDVMTNARQLLANADTQVGSLGPKLGGTAEVASKALETLRVTLLDAQKLVRDVDGQVAPLAGGAKETLAAARSTLGQAQKSLVTLTDAAMPVLKDADKTLAGTTALTAPDSAVLNDLSHTLKALEEAARALRSLANMLERNPETLIRGKSK